MGTFGSLWVFSLKSSGVISAFPATMIISVPLRYHFIPDFFITCTKYISKSNTELLGGRKRGRPQTRLMDVVKEDMRKVGVTEGC